MAKKFNNLNEYNTGPHFAGNPGFRGGPYGFGHTKQLAKVDPQVDKIKKQQDSEHNDNMQSLEYIGSITERTPSDAFSPAPHLPGNLPSNSISNPVNYIPREDPEEMDGGKPVDYFIDDFLLELEEFVSADEVFAYKDAVDLPLVTRGGGVIGTPQRHVPDEHTQSSKFEDDDFDGIPNHVDPNLPSELHMRTRMEQTELTEKIIQRVMEKLYEQQQ